MAQEEPALSKIVPVLVAALVCDVACKEPSTEKRSLIGIFSRIKVGKFPTEHPLSVYMKLADAEGYYKIQVKYVLAKSGQVLAEATGSLNATNKLLAHDFHINFPPLPIPEEGRYEFQIWANSMFLGQTFIDAVPRGKV